MIFKKKHKLKKFTIYLSIIINLIIKVIGQKTVKNVINTFLSIIDSKEERIKNIKLFIKLTL